jgi:hypothetical protein
MSYQNCSINYCLNNGQCFSNGESNNSWWCKCLPCTSGADCGLNTHILFRNPPDVMKLMVQQSSSINYRGLLLFCTIFLVLVGLINNFLSLSTFLNSKSIRSSYNGVYLVAFSICSVYVMIFLGIRYILTLYGSKSLFESYYYQYLYNCYVAIRINAILIHASIWFSSVLAVERTLLDLYFYKLFGMSKKHAIVIILLILVFCTCGRIPPILMLRITSTNNDNGHQSFHCTWPPFKGNPLYDAEVAFIWISSGSTCFMCFLANILTLISIARRKVYLSDNRLTLWQAWCKQLKEHRDYFIPPTVILFSQLGLIIFFEVGKRYSCLESKLDIWAHIHLLVSFLNYLPQTLTFLLFIYPSKKYMKEFYSNTIAGKWCLKFKNTCCTCPTVQSSHL